MGRGRSPLASPPAPPRPHPLPQPPPQLLEAVEVVHRQVLVYVRQQPAHSGGARFEALPAQQGIEPEQPAAGAGGADRPRAGAPVRSPVPAPGGRHRPRAPSRAPPPPPP